MDKNILLAQILSKAERINDSAVKSPLIGIGYAIPIPREATPEAVSGVATELTKRCWDFQRATIDNKEYFVLFLL